jgi:hypothetical protein
MRHLFATLGMLAFVAIAAPAGASPVSPDRLVQDLPDGAHAYVKKGGKGWKGGWKGGKKAKWRGGPPPWAPAHGLRRKRGW